MTSQLEAIKKQNEAILRRLDNLARKSAKWVRASVITDLTGWDGQGMRRARENGSIEFEKRADGYWYDLNSLHPYLIKTK